MAILRLTRELDSQSHEAGGNRMFFVLAGKLDLIPLPITVVLSLSLSLSLPLSFSLSLSSRSLSLSHSVSLSQEDL